MDAEDIKIIEKIISDRKEAHNFLINKKSEVYRTFLKLEELTYSNGALKKIYKELIAVGISVIINCESCMEWHIKQAFNSGASKDQILEAIEVAIEMGGGPATVSSRFALKVFKYYQK
ncbi:MAG: carboxymuconolactone decarboxylase family protein [Candidatus Hermodarchaeota archaeon]